METHLTTARLIVCSLALGLTGSAFAQTSIEKLAPEDTVFIAGASNVTASMDRLKRTGLWELPIGTSAREILEDCAGGMLDGRKLKAWLPGGASTDFLLPEHLDLAMDYDTIAKARSRMGTGLLTVVDDSQPIVPICRNIMEFFARESCGWCTPCRDGLPWTVKLLEALERGVVGPHDLRLADGPAHHRRIGEQELADPGRLARILRPDIGDRLGPVLFEHRRRRLLEQHLVALTEGARGGLDRGEDEVSHHERDGHDRSQHHLLGRAQVP